MENKSSETNIPEIWETEEDKKLSISSLKHKYFAIAREKFNRIPPVIVLNKDKNWLIELSRRVISEWRIKTRTRERIISILLLDTMIEGAKYIKTEKDFKNTFGIESVSYFENQCKINGKLFKINITVKRQKSPIACLLITFPQQKQKNNHIRWVICACPTGAPPRRMWLSATAYL